MKCLLRCVITICWVMILYGSQKKNRVLFLSHVQLPEVVLIKDEDSETEQIVDEGERKGTRLVLESADLVSSDLVFSAPAALSPG